MSPNNPILELLNTGAVSLFYNRIREYNRIVLNDSKRRGISKTKLNAVVTLRDQLPGGQFESLSQLAGANVLNARELNLLAEAFRPENEVLRTENLGNQGFIMGRTYVIYSESFYLPPFDQRDINKRYTIQFTGPNGDQYYFGGFETTVKNIADPDIYTLRIKAVIPYDIPEGVYAYSIYYYDLERVVPLGIAMNVVFVPYTIPLEKDDLFSIRFGKRMLKNNSDFYRKNETVIAVLSGKEIKSDKEKDEVLYPTATSRLRIFVPEKAASPEILNLGRSTDENNVYYYTDVKFAQLDSSGQDFIVAIRGASQSGSRKGLTAGFRVFDPDGIPLTFTIPAPAPPGKSPDIQFTYKAVVNGKTIRGGLSDVYVYTPPVGGPQVLAMVPQLSFLIEESKSSFAGEIFFLGKYGKKSLLVKKETISPTTQGDTIQRPMVAFGNFFPSGPRPLLLVFCKGLALFYDFVPNDIANPLKTPTILQKLQLDDPEGSSTSSSPGRDVANPGFLKDGVTPVDDKQRPNTTLYGTDTRPITNTGGRRYGMIRLVENVDKIKNRGVISVGYSVPRKGTEDGSGSADFLDKEKTMLAPLPIRLLPFQTPVTRFPLVSGSTISNNFYRSEWKFSIGNLTVPDANRPSNGNETYLYRYFTEAFRKEADKETSTERLTFFNGKKLHGGTNYTTVDHYGLNDDMLVPVSEAPFLTVFDYKNPGDGNNQPLKQRTLQLQTTFVRASNGATYFSENVPAILPDTIVLDLIEFPAGKHLLTWKRTQQQPPNEPKIDYERDFGLGLIRVVNESGANGFVSVRFEPININFGNEQPVFQNFDEVDRNTRFQYESTGLQGNDVALKAAMVAFRGNNFLLTATPNDTDSPTKFQLYGNLPVNSDDSGGLEFRKFDDLILPAGSRIVRITDELDSALPKSDVIKGGTSTTVFVIEKVDGSGNKTLWFGRAGKPENGPMQMVEADITSYNSYDQ